MSLTLADWASVATIATSATAALAVVFAIWQTKQFRRQQLEAVARERYQSFLEFCVQYPQFAEGRAHTVDVVKQTFDGEEKTFVQYGWFVWACLNVLEGLYTTVGDQPSWRNTISSILDCHKTYLASEHMSDGIETFEPGFYRFVRPWLPNGAEGRCLHSSVLPAKAAE